MTAREPPTPPPLSQAPIDSAAVVTADAPCRKCGYNVRGLSLVGRCPECGLPVGLSTQGDLLRYSEPRWLATLARGARAIVWGIAAIFLGVIAMLILLAVLAGGGMSLLVPVVVVGVAIVAGYVMMTVGWWLLTTPDPSGIGEDRYGTARKVIRIALIIGLADVLFTIAESVFVVRPDVRMALATYSLLAVIAGVVGIVAQLQYLGKLALRLPDYPMAERAQSIKWGLGITYSIFAAMSAIGELISGRAGAGTAGVFGCVGSLAGLVMLVYFFRYLRLLERLGKAFREQASFARQIWGDVSAAPSA